MWSLYLLICLQNNAGFLIKFFFLKKSCISIDWILRALQFGLISFGNLFLNYITTTWVWDNLRKNFFSPRFTLSSSGNKKNAKNNFTCVACHPKEDCIASGHMDGKIRLWSVDWFIYCFTLTLQNGPSLNPGRGTKLKSHCW
jgi:WD40 repeat protein